METIDDPYQRHLFDENSVFNVYEEDATNLSVGAPGPDLLQQCVKMLKKATDHRLVKMLYFLLQIVCFKCIANMINNKIFVAFLTYYSK